MQTDSANRWLSSDVIYMMLDFISGLDVSCMTDVHSYTRRKNHSANARIDQDLQEDIHDKLCKVSSLKQAAMVAIRR